MNIKKKLYINESKIILTILLNSPFAQSN